MELHERLDCKSMEINWYIYTKVDPNSGVYDSIFDHIRDILRVVLILSQGSPCGDLVPQHSASSRLHYILFLLLLTFLGL